MSYARHICKNRTQLEEKKYHSEGRVEDGILLKGCVIGKMVERLWCSRKERAGWSTELCPYSSCTGVLQHRTQLLGLHEYRKEKSFSQ